jgi:hypothetical protein
MADTMATAGRLAAAATSEQPAFSRAGEVLRDIARGGISGVVAGVVVGGFGGRLVMRIAALLHPDAAGALTENGNRIGDITAGGTLGLVLFGVITCAVAGAVWVVVSPWISGRTGIRALLAAGMAMATGSPLLVIGRNPDFVILDHDPRVVVLLVVLVGLIGLGIALLDSWLERRLPHAETGRRRWVAFYALVTVMGLVLVLPFVLLLLLTSDEYALPVRAGYALLVVGLCTASWWGLRLRGRVVVPPALAIVARGALAGAVILGVLTTAPHIARALGLDGR